MQRSVSQKTAEREMSSRMATQTVDPYWGPPVEGLDEQPLSQGQTMADQPGSRNGDVIHDFKLGQLLKLHWKDWVVIVVLLATDIGLNVIHGFRRYVGVYNIDMLMIKYPLKRNTVPLWSVPIYAVLLPILIFLGYFVKRRNVRDTHHAILGLLTAIFLTGVITDAIKDGVGRPRPDFFFRCFPDGNVQYTQDLIQEVICTGKESDIREGYKSFPSGHTSWSFAGLGYLSFYLAGKVVIFDKRGFTWRLSLVVLPLLAAALVGVSRVDDYWHHWQDVFVGGLIGLTVAYFSYKQHFPDFGHDMAGHPFPHIHVSLPLAASDRPMVNGSYGGRANGGSYDMEAGL
ncbi:hypothetical protein R1flu_002606 [Riccia fluitans]|uniref:Phosphatidic acid phosphatase type 2/haloperoxidase domain-containing protein n=1 Tax=Riccia fluitans TaxID=41844 RepID=A0ABD1Y6L2_9MARC